MNQKPKKYEERLMETLGFREDDLDANRAGRLSERQRIESRQQMDSWLDVVALIIIIAFIITVITVLNGLRQGLTFGDTNMIVMVICGVTLLISGFAWSRRKQAEAITNSKVVSAAEGRVQLDIYEPYRGASEYRLLIEGVGFKLTKPAFLVFKNGDPYRIYYVPHSGRILSVEWLREDDNLLTERENGDG